VETDEVERLIELYDACQRVMAHLSDQDEVLARVIRETCGDVDRRLTELGVQVDEP
jgi:hypothetical protein